MRSGGVGRGLGWRVDSQQVESTVAHAHGAARRWDVPPKQGHVNEEVAGQLGKSSRT